MAGFTPNISIFQFLFSSSKYSFLSHVIKLHVKCLIRLVRKNHHTMQTDRTVQMELILTISYSYLLRENSEEHNIS